MLLSKYQDRGHMTTFTIRCCGARTLENVAIVGKINGGPAIGHGDPKPGNGDKLISVRVGKNLDFENLTHEKGGHLLSAQ